MSEELVKQKHYWDKEVAELDSIYSHGKSKLDNWIDAKFRWDMYARFEYTLKHSEPVQGRSILDVGCGTGRYALEYVRRGARRIVGIDVAPEMVKLCERRARDAGVEARCEFIVSDLTAYEAKEKFDVCIGIGLFDYIRDALPVLSKMARVVSDRAIVSLPRAETWRAPVRRVRLALRGCPVYFYSRAHVDQLMRDAGFKRYELEVVGQLYCVTAYVV